MKGLTERHVQAIWYDAAFRPRRLFTRRGSEVAVIDPGRWNLGPGPDFLGAVLEIGRDRRRVTGDVEVHLCPGDWDIHEHGSDPAYRNVIAHVTWGCGPVPSSLPPGAVSIWIGRFLVSDPSFSPAVIDTAAYPFASRPSAARPCEKSIGHDPDTALAVLSEAGRRRLLMKARRLRGRLCERPFGRRQIFYEEVMTALGYIRNTGQFRHVAERIPLETLPSDPVAARSALLVAGGFEEWERGGVRPGNSPEERLTNAAGLFTSTPTMTFADAYDFTSGACRGMVTAMCGNHLLGRGRAAAIIANVVMPFALAEERITEVPGWLPPEDISEPVRLTAYRMFGRDHNPAAFYASNGLLIQGLLQIHRDCCEPHYPDCPDCTLARIRAPGLSVSNQDQSQKTLRSFDRAETSI